MFVIEKSKAPKSSLKVGGKAKTKIHAMYRFLGGGTYQPPVLSVSFLQVAAGKSRVIYAFLRKWRCCSPLPSAPLVVPTPF